MTSKWIILDVSPLYNKNIFVNNLKIKYYPVNTPVHFFYLYFY